MNSGEEDLDPEVIGNIVQQVVAQLGKKGQQHHGGSTQSSRRVIRHQEIHGEIHGLGFVPSSSGILQSGGPFGGQNAEFNLFNDRLLQMCLTQNQHAESFNRRLERKDQEIDQLKITIADLTNQLRQQKTENASLKEKVERLEATVSHVQEKCALFEEDIKFLLAEKEKRVCKE